MRRDHLAFLIGGLAFGILIGFGLFRAVATRPGQGTETSDAIPSPAGPAAPTEVGTAPGAGGGGDGGAPMMAEINALKERVQKDPKDVEAWARLGGIYQQAQMYEQAAGYFEKAAVLAPADAGVLNELGICYQALRRLDDALAAFVRAQKANPASWEAIFNAVITEAAMRRFDAARADLARLRALKPDAPSLDELEKAVASLEKEPAEAPGGTGGASPR